MPKQSLDVVLPNKPVMEGATLDELTFMFYGPPGIGKSTLASQFVNGPRKPFFLYTNPGLRFIKAYKKPVNSWRAFKKYVQILTRDTPSKYSIIVVDDIDDLYIMCLKEVCEKRGIEHPSDEEWGKGNDLVGFEFRSVLVKLMLLPYGIVFLSYSKETELRGRGIRTKKTVPTLKPAAMKIIDAAADVVGYIGYLDDSADERRAKRYITFLPSETIQAKDRTERLPEEMEFKRHGTPDKISKFLSASKPRKEKGHAIKKSKRKSRKKTTKRKRKKAK